MTREMVLLACKLRREDQSVGRDASLRGLASETATRAHLRSGEPQNAAVDLSQQAHPNAEDVWRDLRGIVEAAEHEPLVGKSGIPSRRRGWGDHACRVVGLKAFRKPHDLLGEMLLISDRN